MNVRYIAIFLTVLLHVSGNSAWLQFHGNAQRTGFAPVAGPTNPHKVWEASVGGPIITSPIIGPDGTIYIGPTLEEKFIDPKVVVTAITPGGTIRWQFKTKFVDTDSPTLSTPALGNGKLYFGSPDGAFYAIDAATGELVWKFQGSQPVIQSPAVAPNGTIYAGIDGKIYSFTASGTVNWSATVGDPRQSGGPALGFDGTIYINGSIENGYNRIWAFRTDGSQKWNHDLLNPAFWPLAPPTVGPDGTIYTVGQGIEALNPATGVRKWYSEPSFGINGYGSIAVDYTHSIYYTNYVYVWKLDATTGALIWQFLLQAEFNFLGSSYSSILATNNGLYMGLGTNKRAATDFEKQMLCLTLTGAQRNTQARLPEIAGTSSPAIAQNGTIYIGSLDGKLYSFHD